MPNPLQELKNLKKNSRQSSITSHLKKEPIPSSFHCANNSDIICSFGDLKYSVITFNVLKSEKLSKDPPDTQDTQKPAQKTPRHPEDPQKTPRKPHSIFIVVEALT